jgi:endonuclease/exonuclease/phosphatase family metal-dependent hydrolase
MTKNRLARWALALCAAALAAVSFVPVASAATKKKDKDPTLKVMTRNIYLGGNIFLPIGAPDRPTFEAKTTELWNQIQFTNFPARAKLLANEVKKTSPDLVGLQEVAIWRRSPTGVKDGSATPSTQVVYDFLKSLTKELKAKGLNYRVARVNQAADIEAPTQQYDVRLTMRDVVLVKRQKGGVKVSKTGGKQYKANIGVPVQTGVITSKRGYAYVDASLKGRKFRFIDTHLESAAEAPRVAQAKELVAAGGPTRTSRPTIVVGDLNSDRLNKTGASPVAYKTITGAGFKDAWLQATKGKETPYTCCLNNALANDPAPFPADHRIDHILLKGKKLRGLKATVVGKDPKNRTKSGLWPSDHAGWVATLRLKK